MEKLDLTKLYKSYYSAKPTPEIIEIEPAQFLSITAKGDPSDKVFSEVVEALYSTAYTIKFSCKELKKDFAVPKLEGLWWYDETKFEGLSVSEAPLKVSRSEWEYRLLIRMPEYVKQEMVQIAVEAVRTKKQISLVEQVGLYVMNKEKCVQMLHVGPFSTEPETLLKINEFMQLNKLVKNGIHHEIYLSDFRKTAPEKLKTILREPVK